MQNKKVKEIIFAAFAIVLIAALAFGIGWLVKNWNALISGTKLFTQEQYQEYGKEKFQEGLGQNETYLQLLERFNMAESKVAELNKEIARISPLKEQNDAYKAKINGLNYELQKAQNELNQAKAKLEAYEEYENQFVEIKFIVEDEVYKISNIKRNATLDLSTIKSPTSGYYTFLGWSVDNENIVASNTYIVKEETTFYAIVETTPLQSVLKANNLVALKESFNLTEGKNYYSQSYDYESMITEITPLNHTGGLQDELKLIVVVDGEYLVLECISSVEETGVIELYPHNPNSSECELQPYFIQTNTYQFRYNDKIIEIIYDLVESPGNEFYFDEMNELGTGLIVRKSNFISVDFGGAFDGNVSRYIIAIDKNF